MNQKTLIGLAVAALVALVAAIAINHANQPQSATDETKSEYLVPDLRGHVDAVSKVVVTGAGDSKIATLERGANGWGVAEKDGYAADTGKLRAFLLNLADAKQIERKTAMKDKYAVLGVEDVSTKDTKGMQVDIDGLATPIKLIVGNDNTHGGGTFVRRVGDAQSWLVSGALTLPRTAADWLKKDIVDVPAKDVTDVTITRADGRGVHLHKDSAADANFKLVDIPKGREAGSPYAVNAPASALADLNLEDVSQARDATPGNDALKVRYLTFDGIVIDITAWKKDDKNYADFNASLDAAQADQGIAADQAKAKVDYEAASTKPDAAKDAKTVDAAVKPLAVSDPSTDHANRLAAVNKKIADLDARFKGWTFALPPYKYASFDKSIDDVLKPLEPKKPATTPAKGHPAKGVKSKR